MKQSQELLIISSLVIAAVGAACSARVDVEAERQALRAASDEYSNAEAAKDAERLSSFYAEGAIMYPPNEPTMAGKENIHKYASNVMAIPDLVMSSRNIELEVSRAGDLGYTVNILDVKLNDPQGNPISEQYRDIHFWKKEPDGKWRVVIDIWNLEPPAASPSASEPNK
jgi:ketosteroid isomerase-like protein